MNANHDYLSPAAVNPAVRIGVLVSEAHSLAFSCRGFFVRSTRQVLWAGRVGRGNPRRPSDRYANLHGSAHPIGVGRAENDNRFQRTTAMRPHAVLVDAARQAVTEAHNTTHLMQSCFSDLQSMFDAIRKLDGNEYSLTSKLASVGSYLASDWSNTCDCQSETLDKLIDELREVLGLPNPKEANHG